MEKNTQTIPTDRYKNMIEETILLNAKYNLNINLSCDKTLYEIMHIQTRYSMQTPIEEFKGILQIDSNKKMNDTIELFYTKNYTICPILFDIILFMSSPDDVGGISLPFNNQRTLIFDYTRLFYKETFDTEYLIPFYESQVLPKLEEGFKNKMKEKDRYREAEIKHVLNSKNNWLNEYTEGFYKNLFVITYTSLLELLIKVQNIPNLCRTIKEISLIIIDSPNLLLNQTVNVEYENELAGENAVHRKSSVNFENKRKSGNKYNKQDQCIYEVITTVLNNLQKEFNFNIVLTFYDFQRITNLSLIKFKMSNQNFVFDNYNNFYKISIGKEQRLEFYFILNNFACNSKIYSLEPVIDYVNFDCNVFAYIIHIEGNKYRFYAFLRKSGVYYPTLCDVQEMEFIGNK